MEHIERSKKTIYFYKAKAKSKMAEFNKVFTLPTYFASMIGEKTEVTIADLGAGPVSTTGSIWLDIKVDLYPSDVLEPTYANYYKNRLIPIDYQDMEKLTYKDNMFDIVHCVNAIDHTPDLKRALMEMKRVCKPGGWIYLRHSPDQRTRYRGQHEWDAGIEDGVAVFQDESSIIRLPEFTTTLEGDLIISKWQKPI